MSKLNRLPSRYSGPKSEKFWKRINALRGARAVELYRAGVALQNQETVVLNELEKAEKAGK